MLAGILLNVARPLPIVPAVLALPVGGTLVGVAVTLFWLAVRRLRVAGTPVRGNRPTTAIVGTGPYSLSRNPVYLAMSALHLGIASWANNAWLVTTLAMAVALMAIVVIPREERYLAERFGADYLDYKASVRRWL